jgi:hypothetical protein
LIEENASSGELLYWSSPDSQRREVSVVARDANGSIPIAFLSTRLNVYALPIQITKCESLRAFFDKVAERNELMWCVTERGLWMAQQPPLGTVYVDSHGILHSGDSSEGDQREAGQAKRAPARGGLFAAAKQLARKERLEERLRKEVDPEVALRFMSSPTAAMLDDYDVESLQDAIREVAIPALEKLKEREAQARIAPLPGVSLPLVSLPRNPLLNPAPASRQDVLTRFRGKRRGISPASMKFDEEIGERMHEARQKLREDGVKTRRQRNSPTLPPDTFKKVVKAADAVRKGNRVYPLKEVLTKGQWERVANHNKKRGGVETLGTFSRLLKHPQFKVAAHKRFNRAETYFRTKLADPLRRVQEARKTEI